MAQQAPGAQGRAVFWGFLGGDSTQQGCTHAMLRPRTTVQICSGGACVTEIGRRQKRRQSPFDRALMNCPKGWPRGAPPILAGSLCTGDTGHGEHARDGGFGPGRFDALRLGYTPYTGSSGCQLGVLGGFIWASGAQAGVITMMVTLLMSATYSKSPLHSLGPPRAPDTQFKVFLAG